MFKVEIIVQDEDLYYFGKHFLKAEYVFTCDNTLLLDGIEKNARDMISCDKELKLFERGYEGSINKIYGLGVGKENPAEDDRLYYITEVKVDGEDIFKMDLAKYLGYEEE